MRRDSLEIRQYRRFRIELACVLFSDHAEAPVKPYRLFFDGILGLLRRRPLTRYGCAMGACHGAAAGDRISITRASMSSAR